MVGEADGDSTSEDVAERYDLAGKKLAYIFSWGTRSTSSSTDPNEKDVKIMVKTLKDLGFEFDQDFFGPDGLSDDSSSDSDSTSEKELPTETALRDLRILDLLHIMSIIELRAAEARCIFMYFITRPTLSFLFQYSKIIPIHNLWRRLKNLNCPKLFLTQANITSKITIRSVLMNAENGSSESKIPASGNSLLAYFPCLIDASISPAEILREELVKPYDINTIMTNVIDRINLDNKSLNPKFSSTLHKQLYLTDGPKCPNEIELPTYSISEGRKCLAYIFLFGKFDVCSPLMRLVDLDTVQMTSAFNNLGFNYEFCVKDGHMTVEEFHAKLKEIVHDKEKMKTCECIMFFVSSHGEGDDVIYASDGLISKDLIVHCLSACEELEGKPKLLFVDACRGSMFERAVQVRESSSSVSGAGCSATSATMFSSKRSHKIYDKDICDLSYYVSPKMYDVLIVMSSTEGRVSVFCTKQGSYFIRNLCENLEKYGRDYDLMTVLNALMRTVAKETIKYYGQELKQQITFTSCLRKHLRFPNK